MVHTGNITLPDGRVVYGRIVTTWERDTNATNIHSCDLEWLDGNALTADEYNEDFGGIYLHEFVTDLLLLRVPNVEVG